MGKHKENDADGPASGILTRLCGRRRVYLGCKATNILGIGSICILQLIVMEYWWGSGNFWLYEIRSASQIFSDEFRINEDLQVSPSNISSKVEQHNEVETPQDQHILTRRGKQSSPPTKAHTKNELLEFMLGNAFLPLKDVEQPGMTDTDTNWFMSRFRSKPPDGSGETFDLPVDDPKGRILCVSGNNRSDGTKNSYGLFNKKALPPNSTFLTSITFIADNFWDYESPWQSMSALVNFVTWRIENRCLKPERLLLYHKGALVTSMGPWITNVLQASYMKRIPIMSVNGGANSLVCFERAVIQRRGLGKVGKDRINALFDMVRCRTRRYCGLEPLTRKSPNVEVLLLTREGRRAFKNESAVTEVVQKECMKVAGCNFRVLNIGNLSFCKQVEVMSSTDVLISVHGGQLTNMMFMTPGSRIMEMFPKGWLELAGIGQDIYKWHADWTRIIHEGRWRDPEGPECPYPQTETLKCFLFFKDMEVGVNATILAEWTATVLKKVTSAKEQKLDDVLISECACDEEDRSSGTFATKSIPKS